MATAAFAGVWLLTSAAAAQEPAAPPAGRVAFLARADNPVDALAASSVAGQLGGIVLLTDSDALHPDAAAALAAFGPDLVVLAGGTAALSTQVEADVIVARFEARRVAGAGRIATAAALAALVDELIGPFAAAADVAALAGQVEVLTERIAAAEAANGALASRVVTLERQQTAFSARVTTAEAAAEALTGRVTAAEARVAALEERFAGVTRTGALLSFSGMNVQVVNGTQTTASTNELGNLIIGYNEDAVTGDCQFGSPCEAGDGAADARSGSHMLVIGPDHSWTGFGGIVAGIDNAARARYATVTGGRGNIASGRFSAVTGGHINIADGNYAAVTGGESNAADGSYSAVIAGHFNRALQTYAAVSGGESNTASGRSAAVSGGEDNTADGEAASVSGGGSNMATGFVASIAGGLQNTAGFSYSAVAGGRLESIIDSYDSHIGIEAFPDS